MFGNCDSFSEGLHVINCIRGIAMEEANRMGADPIRSDQI